MMFSLASLIVFYEGMRKGQPYPVSDDQAFLDLYAKLWSSYDHTLDGAYQIAKTVLGLEDHWEMDLNDIDGLTDFVAQAIFDIKTNGMKEAIKRVL